MRMKNLQGFTLMELLVVIVILALLVAIAAPQVLNLLESGQQDTFRNEAKSMISIMENAYAAKSMSGSSDIKAGTCNGVSCRTLCMTLEELKNQGYLDKDLGSGATGWKGYVRVEVPVTGAAIYYISITNGTYYLPKVESDDIDSTEIVSNNIPSSITCPTQAAST